MEKIQSSFDEVGKAIASAEKRVILGESVSSAKKAFSLADADAYMICKGSRDPLLGSSRRLVAAEEDLSVVSRSSVVRAADPTRLRPMVMQHN